MIDPARALAEIPGLAEARRKEPAGARARALRRLGETIGDRLRTGAEARRIELLAIDRLPCPIERAVDEGARTALRWTVLERRTLYLELEIEGAPRAVLVDPAIAGSWRRTPWGAWFCEAHPRRAARLAEHDRALEDALLAIGVSPDAIELAILTQLRGVDVAALLGTVRGDGLRGPRPSVLPRARWIVPGEAWRAALDPHDVERPFLVRDAMERVDAERVHHAVDRWIGTGAAVIATPGWSAGGASVFVRTPRGVVGWSSLGVAVDQWSPYHAKIGGLRQRVRELDVECVPRGDAIARQEAVISMSLERAIVDRQLERPAMHAIHPREHLVAHPLLAGHPER